MTDTNLSWAQAQPLLFQGKRIRRAGWPEGDYLDLKAGKYRRFNETRGEGTKLLYVDWAALPPDSEAEDWEAYEPMFYSSDS